MASASAIRREELLAVLKRSSAPVTGSQLSSALGVSRQGGLTAVIRCHHGPERGREEFEILLDRGVSVLGVGVEHSVFGEVRAKVLVESRADIDRHAEAIRKSGEAPLSIITRGIHSHTVRAPSEEALEVARRELAERGILLDD